jgi:hypothetical protein
VFENVFGAHDCLYQTIKAKGVVILSTAADIDLIRTFKTRFHLGSTSRTRSAATAEAVAVRLLLLHHFKHSSWDSK